MIATRQSNTYTDQRESDLMVVLSFLGEWTFTGRTYVTTRIDIEPSDKELANAAFKLSSNALQKFLEEEEEGSLFD